MNERLHITLCKGSKPGDYERYSLARLPVPGGARRGKSEQIFLSHSGVTHALGRAGADTEVVVDRAAYAELSSDFALIPHTVV